jgi:hypothetical protein
VQHGFAAVQHRAQRRRCLCYRRFTVEQWHFRDAPERPACDDYRRINRCAEQLPRLGEIVKLDNVGMAKEMRSEAATGERSPQLCRNEERNCSRGFREGYRPLHE